MAREAPRFDRTSEWLSHCQGFVLEIAGKRLGVVVDVLYGADDLPAALVVCGGLFGTRVSMVPVENVLEVVPTAKRVVAGADPLPT